MIFILAILALADAALAEEGKLIFASGRAEARIKGVTLDTEEVEIVTRAIDGRPVEMITLRGELENREVALVFQDVRAHVEPGSESSATFTVEIPVRGDLTPVTLLAIDPEGAVASDEFVIKRESPELANVPQPAFAPIQSKANEAAYEARGVTASAGPTLLQYQQTGKPDFSQTALTVKAAAQLKVIPPAWELGANAFYTVLPLTTNLAGVSVRYLGVNLRFGRALPWINDPWRITINAGFYYNSMSVAGADFGYRNVAGPEIYPVVRRSLSGGQMLAAYVKFAPVASSFALLGLSNRELAAGASWARRLESGRTLVLLLDYAEISLDLSIAASSATTTAGQAKSRAVSVAAGLGF